MLTFLAVIPIAAAASALVFRDKPWVRRASVVVILLAFGAIVGMLVAPHRLAEDLLAQPPETEWTAGAQATRDIVHRAVPVVLSTMVSLAALALIPSKKLNR